MENGGRGISAGSYPMQAKRAFIFNWMNPCPGVRVGRSGGVDGLGWQRQRGQQGEDSGMRVALVNPHWSFEGSIYFGCREPHLPLELGCAAALLEAAGHESLRSEEH